MGKILFHMYENENDDLGVHPWVGLELEINDDESLTIVAGGSGTFDQVVKYLQLAMDEDVLGVRCEANTDGSLQYNGNPRLSYVPVANKAGLEKVLREFF